MATTALHWFRKGLRLHDNPALLEACASKQLIPLFCIDPHFANADYVGVNRYKFMLDCLADLDSQLRALGSRLVVLRGKPEDVLPRFVQQHSVTLVTFEADTETYARARDADITETLNAAGVGVSVHSTHTLHNIQAYIDKNQSIAPSTFRGFVKLFSSMGLPRAPVPAPQQVPPPPLELLRTADHGVPTLTDMGYSETATTSFLGGETEALRRLAIIMSRPPAVDKPKPTAETLLPSNTVTSPYLKFGCLSAARLFHEAARKLPGTSARATPPMGLHRQLVWREFFYMAARQTPLWEKMAGNNTVRQIPWDNDDEMVRAWAEGRTGFPFIDAIMTQLRVEGWIHNEARQRVACFLTRGDLWQHWEAGARVFDRLLLDADPAINIGNWLWMSCSRYNYQYYRVYSPVFFGAKADPKGEYVRKYLPVLQRFPPKFIYEPWTAPLTAQMAAGCVIGKQYPSPMVQHDTAIKSNMDRMSKAYAEHKKALADGDGDDDDDEEEEDKKPTPKKTKPKQESEKVKRVKVSSS